MVSKKSKGKTKGQTGSERHASTETSSTNLVNDVAMYDPSVFSWQKTLFGPLFPTPRECAPAVKATTLSSLVYSIKNFLDTNEEAKVVIFSIMVLLLLFWILKTMLSLIINLVCPLLVLLIGVLCIPPLREPLLGQNYPTVANFIRGILLKIADSI